MDTGIVKFFDSRPEKRFGFIVPDQPGQPEIFFHLNDGQKIIAGKEEPYGDPSQRLERIPQKGDHIVYKVALGKKGPKAYPWGYEDEYNAALAAIASRPKPLRYRVLHTFDSPPGKTGEPYVEWGGENGRSLEDLCARYPRDRHDDLRSFSDSDNIFDSHYQIQVNDGSGWKNASEDPRPVVSGFVRRRMF